jgi:hypothetical protein
VIYTSLVKIGFLVSTNTNGGMLEKYSNLFKKLSTFDSVQELANKLYDEYDVTRNRNFLIHKNLLICLLKFKLLIISKQKSVAQGESQKQRFFYK